MYMKWNGWTDDLGRYAVMHVGGGWFGLLGFKLRQQSGSYDGGEMLMKKSVFWWRKPEYPEETTDPRHVEWRGNSVSLKCCKREMV